MFIQYYCLSMGIIRIGLPVELVGSHVIVAGSIWKISGGEQAGLSR
jgi:hypothetical protein